MAEQSPDAHRLDALEQLGHVQNDALRLLVDHVRALTLVNASLVATLDEAGRGAVRTAALIGLGDGGEAERARALIGALTQDPLSARDAATTVGLGRLQ